MSRSPVYLWNLGAYDPEQVHRRVLQAMDELDIRPQGRVLVKPNTVIAHPTVFPHAFTRAEVLDGVLAAIKERMGPPGEQDELVVGERCGITVPTRMVTRLAGYPSAARRHGAALRYFDEEPQVEVPLRHDGRLRDSLYLPQTVARADFMVNCPKFKTHPWTSVTFALKNYIGIQDDAHRLVDHDYRLDEKICDLNFTVQPKLIVIDGVVAGMGRMLNPRPLQLGLLVIGTNPVATDAICCRIAGLEPEQADHIRMAGAMGLGPTGLDEIELRGDVGLDEACERARQGGLHDDRVRVEPFFEGTNMRGLAGPPPDPERTDYCWGGCPGASQEAYDIIKQLQPDAGQKVKPLALLYGAYTNRELQLRPGERLLIFGDCARFDGQLRGQPTRIDSCYVARRQRCIHQAKATGVVTKTLAVLWMLLRKRKQPYLRVKGCPVSVAEHVLLMSLLGGLRNPYLDPRVVVPFVRAWTANVIIKFFKRIIGRMGLRPLPHPPGSYPAVDQAEGHAEQARERVAAREAQAVDPG